MAFTFEISPAKLKEVGSFKVMLKRSKETLLVNILCWFVRVFYEALLCKERNRENGDSITINIH